MSVRLPMLLFLVLLFGKTCNADDTSTERASPAAQSRFKISPDTTVILNPLDRYGYPDYLADLNNRLRVGITRDNNAARSILLTIQADSSVEVPPGMSEVLEVDGNEPRRPYFTPEAFAEKRFPGNSVVQSRRLSEQIEIAKNRVWKATEFPLVVDWLESNRDALRQAHLASQQSRWYSPAIATALPAVINVQLPISQQLRNLARALTIRAMLTIGTHEFEAAWNDILAMHRLARLQSQGHFMVSLLVAHVVESAAFECETLLIQDSQLPMALLERIRRDRSQLTPLLDFDAAVDQGDRYLLLDVICHIARTGSTTSESGLASTYPRAHPLVNRALQFAVTRFVNWNTVLRTMNRWVDESLDILHTKQGVSRLDALWNQKRRIINLKGHEFRHSEWQHPPLIALLVLRNEASQWLADELVLRLFPDISSIAVSFNRAKVRHSLLNVGWALRSYNQKHGQYPEELDSLVPEFVEQIPEDVLTGHPLKYESNRDSFLLYSFGTNRADDHAMTWHEHEKADDIVVRSMPGPRVKKE